MKPLEWHTRFALHHLKTAILKKLGLYDGYVSDNIKSRKGTCTLCGRCCMHRDTLERCIHYKNRTGKCDTWGRGDYCAWRCADFPIDEEYAKLIGCKAYTWDER